MAPHSLSAEDPTGHPRSGYLIQFLPLQDQPTHHWDYTGSIQPQTFKQRVLINDSWWGGVGSPILFYTGNEGDIESFAQNTGLIWQMAPELKVKARSRSGALWTGREAALGP